MASGNQSQQSDRPAGALRSSRVYAASRARGGASPRRSALSGAPGPAASLASSLWCPAGPRDRGAARERRAHQWLPIVRERRRPKRGLYLTEPHHAETARHPAHIESPDAGWENLVGVKTVGHHGAQSPYNEETRNTSGSAREPVVGLEPTACCLRNSCPQTSLELRAGRP